MVLDIACIVFVCVTANHLGLIAAIKSVTKRNRLWVLDCPKCLTRWCVLTYQLVTGCNLLAALAISFLCAYLAIWLELLEGYIDTLYNRIYDTLYSTTDTTDADAQRT